VTSLNRQPVGLLDFFGIKNGGRYPEKLGDVVLPQMNVLSLYEWAGPLEFGSSSGNLAGGVTTFGPAGLTSLPGDSWHFDSLSVRFNTSAAGSFAGVRLGKYYAAQAVFVGFTETIYAAQGVAPVVKSLFLQDTWLGPGWSLAYEVIELNAAVPFQAAWVGTRYRW